MQKLKYLIIIKQSTIHLIKLFDLFKVRSKTSFERFKEWLTKKVEEYYD